MSEFFHIFLTQPLFNALVLLYKTLALEDLGLAIIMLTIIIRLILYPLFYRGYKNQTLLQKIQPEIKRIQHDHRHNRERQAQALLALYREHRLNPFSGFLLILIQLPILFALYRVFLSGFSPETWEDLYRFITPPNSINNNFLDLIDLAKPNIIIVGLSAVAQYFQGKLTIPKSKGTETLSPTERIAKQMIFIGPILTLVVLYSLPSAIGLYWLTTSIFSVGQQILINKSLKNNDTISRKDEEDAGTSGFSRPGS